MSDLVGAQLRVLNEDQKLQRSVGFTNPNFTSAEFEPQIESEFAYTRLSFCENNTTLIAESWIKPELVQMSDVKELEIFS